MSKTRYTSDVNRGSGDSPPNWPQHFRPVKITQVSLLDLIISHEQMSKKWLFLSQLLIATSWGGFQFFWSIFNFTWGHDPVGLIFSELKIARELTKRSGDESGHVRMALKTVELMEKMTPSQRLGTAKLNNTELWMDVDLKFNPNQVDWNTSRFEGQLGDL